MNNELDNLVFNTKSIMITDKQKRTIEGLLDELTDMCCDDYADVEYWKMSKKDASSLIRELIDLRDALSEDCNAFDYIWREY